MYFAHYARSAFLSHLSVLFILDVLLNTLWWQIESLDAKLNRAEEEEQGKKQLEEELKASQAMVIRLDTKCELLEKVSCYRCSLL